MLSDHTFHHRGRRQETSASHHLDVSFSRGGMCLLILSLICLLWVVSGGSSSSVIVDDKTTIKPMKEEEEEDPTTPLLPADDVQLLEQVLKWAKEEKGSMISRKVEIRPITDTLVGLYATVPIYENEIIMSTPWSAILRSPLDNTTNQDDDDEDEKSDEESSSWCHEVEFVRSAVFGKPVHFQTPYERYLSTRSRQSIPRFWSKAGRELLHELMEPCFYLEDGLDCDIDSAYWKDENDFTTPFDPESHSNALMLLQTRGEGPNGIDLMPIHDLMNHRNGKYTNARPIYIEDEKYLAIAQRDIEAGEQLQNSYNQCDWCEYYSNPTSAYRFHVTPQIFELYGFVELMPQRWAIPDQRILFDIDEKKVTNGDDNDDDSSNDPFKSLEVNFVVPLSRAGFDFLRQQVPRLREFLGEHQDDDDIDKTRRAVPSQELQAIFDLRAAMEVAFSVALAQSHGQMSEEVWTQYEDDWYFEEEDDDDDDDDDDEEEEENGSSDDEDENNGGKSVAKKGEDPMHSEL